MENQSIVCSVPFWPPTMGVVSDAFTLIEKHNFRVASVSIPNSEAETLCQIYKEHITRNNNGSLSIFGASIKTDANPYTMRFSNDVDDDGSSVIVEVRGPNVDKSISPGKIMGPDLPIDNKPSVGTNPIVYNLGHWPPTYNDINVAFIMARTHDIGISYIIIDKSIADAVKSTMYEGRVKALRGKPFKYNQNQILNADVVHEEPVYGGCPPAQTIRLLGNRDVHHSHINCLRIDILGPEATPVPGPFIK